METRSVNIGEVGSAKAFQLELFFEKDNREGM